MIFFQNQGDERYVERRNEQQVGGSRSGFWQNEKPHKFHKSAVLISNYVGFLEPDYHVYTTTNVGFDFGGECKS
jgi:hypothetical protein